MVGASIRPARAYRPYAGNVVQGQCGRTLAMWCRSSVVCAKRASFARHRLFGLTVRTAVGYAAVYYTVK